MSPMTQPSRAARRTRYLRIGAVALVAAIVIGATSVATDTLGMGGRFERLVARIEAFIDPPPSRPGMATVVVTQRPTPSPTPATPEPSESAFPHQPSGTPTPSPTPMRRAVDVNLAPNTEAVFASQLTEKDCAVAGTQMVLTVLGLGSNSAAFQTELHDRIGEWESWEDSHNGNWGPSAVSLALAAYGAPGYEVRAYDTYTDALRDSAIAISELEMPVVMFPWWGAHTWVMTGYRADADPTFFPDAAISGAYILDPWYPRTSSIWGQSDAPGNFEDLAELERNWPVYGGPPPYQEIGPGWTRPEGAYPGRDGKFVVLIPTIPRSASAGGAAP
jgi:hypothetical protein